MPEHDFIIAGSGGGGFTAALVIAEAGLKPLIIEKRDKVGGTTGYSGGVVWIPDNPLMRRDGVPDSPDQARLYLDNLIGPSCPSSTSAKRDAYVREGPKAIAFLEKLGMIFSRAEGWSDYHDELPGGSARGRGLVAPLFNLNRLGEWRSRLSLYESWTIPTNSAEFQDLMLVKKTWAGKRAAARLAWRLLKQKLLGRTYRGSGAALQGRLLEIALAHHIPIMTETALTDLVEENGRVVGVRANGPEGPVEIRAARGVLLNTGGFAHDAARREKLQPKPTPRWTNANPADTGDGLDAALALGADTHNLDLSWYTPTSVMEDGRLPPGVPAPFMHHLDLAKPHVILVDAKGRRFADESGSYHDIGKAMYDLAEWPMWAIIESRHRSDYPWGTQPPGRPPREWIESGYMIEAPDIETLAERTGIDRAGLEATIISFNKYSREGVDPEQNRGARAFDRHHGDPTHGPNPNLGAIERPPFYAVRMVPGDIGTDGGLVTDEHGAVLRADGRAIEGLYATGNVTASVMGRAYPGPGGTIGPALVFGYIAAMHAAAGGKETSKEGSPHGTL